MSFDDHYKYCFTNLFFHRYMSSTLLRVAGEHNSVVAVVGKGHLPGIKKNWKQHIEVIEVDSVVRLNLCFLLYIAKHLEAKTNWLSSSHI